MIYDNARLLLDDVRKYAASDGKVEAVADPMLRTVGFRSKDGRNEWMTNLTTVKLLGDDPELARAFTDSKTFAACINHGHGHSAEDMRRCRLCTVCVA